MMQEEWRLIVDWPDYAVSNLGRVKRITTWGRGKAGAIRKPVFVSGYAAVTLTDRAGRRKLLTIHRLVAAAFLPEPSAPGMEVNHKDADRTNPRLDNLEWVTKSANRQHGYDFGFADAKGEANGYSKLTEAQVLDIRRSGASSRANWPGLAMKHGVSKATIRDVVTGRTWAHLSAAA